MLESSSLVKEFSNLPEELQRGLLIESGVFRASKELYDKTNYERLQTMCAKPPMNNEIRQLILDRVPISFTIVKPKMYKNGEVWYNFDIVSSEDLEQYPVVSTISGTDFKRRITFDFTDGKEYIINNGEIYVKTVYNNRTEDLLSSYTFCLLLPSSLHYLTELREENECPKDKLDELRRNYVISVYNKIISHRYGKELGLCWLITSLIDSGIDLSEISPNIRTEDVPEWTEKLFDLI